MRIAELIDRNYGRVHIFLRSLSGSAVVADDLTQEAFLRLLKLRVPEGRIEESYLMRVAYTCWIRYSENLRPMVSLEDIPPVAIYDCPHEKLEGMEDALAVRRCLARMSPEHREILVVVSCLGYRFVEASEILGVPRTTLVSRHRRALQWLKACLRSTME